uniref:Uncharacterized protein n=1 Tax=Rhizophora mucronata TaxID=61149 RepID=A0A2P2JEW0_RHIMU
MERGARKSVGEVQIIWKTPEMENHSICPKNKAVKKSILGSQPLQPKGGANRTK